MIWQGDGTTYCLKVMPVVSMSIDMMAVSCRIVDRRWEVRRAWGMLPLCFDYAGSCSVSDILHVPSALPRTPKSKMRSGDRC
jgi:hypothetical protein